MKQSDPIPQYFLYGEDRHYEDSDFVHIESIEARSQREHWSIKPHWHGKLFQALLFSSGAATIQLDNRRYHLSNSGLVLIPAGVVHSFQFTPETQGYVLTVAEPIINQSAQSRAVRYLSAITQHPRAMQMAPDSRFRPQLMNYLQLMQDEFNAEQLEKGSHVQLIFSK